MESQSMRTWRGALISLARHEPLDRTLSDAARRIELVISDYDGCIAPYREKPDESLMKALRDAIIAAQRTLDFAVVTGKEVSKLSEFSAELHVPVLGEMGGVLQAPDGEVSILVDDRKIKFVKLIAGPLDVFLNAKFPGHQKHEKQTMLTYTRPDGVEMEEFVASIRGYLQSRGLDNALDLSFWSKNSIDITFHGENKAKAVRHLAMKYNVDISRILFVGDSNNDGPAFQATTSMGGFAVAPANADASIREFVANDVTGRAILHPLESTACVLDVVSTIYYAKHRVA